MQVTLDTEVHTTQDTLDVINLDAGLHTLLQDMPGMWLI